MMAALIRGERSPKMLAQLARSSLRGKIAALEEAFTGPFSDHHAFLLTTMLARIDGITADIATLDQQITRQVTPLAATIERLDEIPGIGLTATHAILAEIGPDMSRFPTAAHLTSWAKFAPTVKESAGRRKGKNATGHGNR
ncbi:transposase, partial [Streptomyces anulatus]|uniref:transposase n=1 Tax=Streptomyces anulatus TaxID=1892 RepID=UPI00343A5155